MITMRINQSGANSKKENSSRTRRITDPLGILVRALLAADSAEALSRLLDDLCTINEIQAMTQRLEVAQLLNEGVTYQDIERRTGASAATISRVNRSLVYGSNGYKQALNALDSINQNGNDQSAQAKGE